MYISSLAGKMFGRCASLLRTRTVLFFRKQAQELAPPQNVIELAQADFARLKADPSQPWANEIGDSSWFDNGGRLFAVQWAGTAVCFGWATFARSFDVCEIRCRVELEQPVLWIWACFTPSIYRKCGHYPTLLKGMRSLSGSPETVIYCDRSNTASRRGIQKAGFDQVFSVFGHRLFHVSNGNTNGLLQGLHRH